MKLCTISRVYDFSQRIMLIYITGDISEFSIRSVSPHIANPVSDHSALSSRMPQINRQQVLSALLTIATLNVNLCEAYYFDHAAVTAGQMDLTYMRPSVNVGFILNGDVQSHATCGCHHELGQHSIYTDCAWSNMPEGLSNVCITRPLTNNQNWKTPKISVPLSGWTVSGHQNLTVYSVKAILFRASLIRTGVKLNLMTSSGIKSAKCSCKWEAPASCFVIENEADIDHTLCQCFSYANQIPPCRPSVLALLHGEIVPASYSLSSN